ncbi:sporulation protein YabP [Clostridium fallax]|uniref:Sporulation protein YabP n=1 Tax=Clostridium fallax TaxID=1533 RepID=A0A1M4TEK0_9CLOT|nr:sporulation protein YabP [Clostridium fallax]SHE42871.1 sporulation protein YabP [Clostridium fallax]SQB22726.1 sporulation protein YabP [Clostridium fallax]
MENKKDIKLENKKSNLTLESRKKLLLTGVVEVISFDEEKILLNTQLGMLSVKGSSLKMNKLDVQNGDVAIMGSIYSMVYSSHEVKKEKKSIIKRLFK